VNESGVAEQPGQGAAIKAPSTAMARAMARIGNAEGGVLDGLSGHVSFVHSFSEGLDKTNMV
jgi:hypothetical protein